jgi:hypothetical protein
MADDGPIELEHVAYKEEYSRIIYSKIRIRTTLVVVQYTRSPDLREGSSGLEDLMLSEVR